MKSPGQAFGKEQTVLKLQCEIGRERFSEIHAMPKTHATQALAADSAGSHPKSSPFCTQSGRALK
jgi:hypothetical protein